MIRLSLSFLAPLLLIPLALAPAAPVPFHLMPKDPPLAFPTKVGTTWVYEGNGGTQTITISEVTEEKDGAKLVTTERVLEDGKRAPHMVRRISGAGVFILSEGRHSLLRAAMQFEIAPPSGADVGALPAARGRRGRCPGPDDGWPRREGARTRWRVLGGAYRPGNPPRKFDEGNLLVRARGRAGAAG